MLSNVVGCIIAAIWFIIAGLIAALMISVIVFLKEELEIDKKVAQMRDKNVQEPEPADTEQKQTGMAAAGISAHDLMEAFRDER